MNFCRCLQQLRRSDGIRSLMFQKLCLSSNKSALAAAQSAAYSMMSRVWMQKSALEQHRDCPSTLSENYELRTIDKTDRHDHPSPKSGSGTMAKSLVKTVKGLSDVKEEVYGALDEWAAFELEFPIVATRKALERLRQQEQWHRIIQVSKWMLSKGVGKTNDTHALMLKAYCMDGRLEEAEELWDKLVTTLNRNMPKNMFAFMTNAYRKREMPEKVVEVFERMENFGIKPDKDLLRRAEEAYQQLNMEEKVKILGSKYALDSKIRRKEKRLMARKASKPEKSKNDHSTEYQTDDEVNVQEQWAATVQLKQTGNTTGGISNSSKGSKLDEKSEADLCADDKFVMQIISTM